MEFIYKGQHGIEIKFEDGDNETDIRMVEQAIAFLRNLLTRFKGG